jgi:hypothetical protein
MWRFNLLRKEVKTLVHDASSMHVGYAGWLLAAIEFMHVIDLMHLYIAAQYGAA